MVPALPEALEVFQPWVEGSAQGAFEQPEDQSPPADELASVGAAALEPAGELPLVESQRRAEPQLPVAPSPMVAHLDQAAGSEPEGPWPLEEWQRWAVLQLPVVPLQLVAHSLPVASLVPVG